MADSFFLPKGTEGRKKLIMILHIQGLILMLVLILALVASLGMLARTIFNEGVLRYMPTGTLYNTLMYGSPEGLDLSGGMYSLMTFDPNKSPIVIISKIWKVVSLVSALVFLGLTIFMVYKMKKTITGILDDPYPMENPIRVKKATYVWLGFLLGAFGAHFFVTKQKKRAIVFLILGIVGSIMLPIAFIYTTGISFADAFLACYIPKDADGFIEVEEYPHWI